MSFDGSMDNDWFGVQIADLIIRIRHLQAADGKACVLDENWSRIYGLLVHLHEHLTTSSDREAMSPLMLKLDLELMVIEALVACLSSRDTSGSLH